MTVENTKKMIGKAWKAHDGSIRYYINNWQDMIGLQVRHYKTGNVSSVIFKDYQISNSHYIKYISDTKVWIDENNRIHVDYCRDNTIRRAIIVALSKRLEE